MRLTAFFKLYTMCTLLHRCNLSNLSPLRSDLGQPLGADVDLEVHPLPHVAEVEVGLPHVDVPPVDRHGLLAGDEAPVAYAFSNSG